jgi:hypothetical protein
MDRFAGMHAGREFVMIRVVLLRSAAVVVSVLLTPAPAVAALDVKPGLWEMTIAGSGEGTNMKACLTRELLDADFSEIQMPEGVECINEIREETPKYTISHTVCTGAFAIEGDTRIDVLSSESMSMHSTSVMNFGGQPQSIETNIQYTWLSSDCGDVKPVDLNALAE